MCFNIYPFPPDSVILWAPPCSRPLPRTSWSWRPAWGWGGGPPPPPPADGTDLNHCLLSSSNCFSKVKFASELKILPPQRKLAGPRGNDWARAGLEAGEAACGSWRPQSEAGCPSCWWWRPCCDISGAAWLSWSRWSRRLTSSRSLSPRGDHQARPRGPGHQQTAGAGGRWSGPGPRMTSCGNSASGSLRGPGLPRSARCPSSGSMLGRMGEWAWGDH